MFWNIRSADLCKGCVWLRVECSIIVPFPMNFQSRKHTNTLHKVTAHMSMQSQSKACTFQDTRVGDFVTKNCRFVPSFSFNVLLPFNTVFKVAHMLIQTWMLIQTEWYCFFLVAYLGFILVSVASRNKSFWLESCLSFLDKTSGQN